MAGERSDIAHLFRRAGFGARPEELTYYDAPGRGFGVAVDDLLAAKPIAGGQASFREGIDSVWKPATNLRGRVVVPDLNEIQNTWLARMVTTAAPLVERMTLFLHDHFATAYHPEDTIDTPELQAQNDLFRANALGNWRTLCHAMIDDVAMSAWLDNNVNYKNKPNENLAREFMELFTLGPGNYTESDIRNAARALTGYEVAYNLELTGPRNSMVFNPAKHDDADDMTIFGVGPRNFLPHEFVDLALAQPAAPRFLATKLIETFAMPNPSSTFVTRIANNLRTSGWQIASALRAIFTSVEFRSAAARNSVVKSPAEFVAGALRALGRTNGDDTQAGLNWMRQAGQVLFDPPNVGGWPVNEGWLGAGGVLARYNAASALADRHVAAFVVPGQTMLRATTPTGWGEIFGMTDLAPATVNALNSYLSGATLQTDPVRDAAMITLVVASPDFSLA